MLAWGIDTENVKNQKWLILSKQRLVKNGQGPKIQEEVTRYFQEKVGRLSNLDAINLCITNI